MNKSFSCTNILYNGDGPRYISSRKEIEKIKDNVINLRCHIVDYIVAQQELKDVDGKIINYFIVMHENIRKENFRNLFNVFETLKDNSNILGLELKLKSKISKSNFEKLIKFLDNVQQKFDFRLNLGNLEVFDINQLVILSTINNNIDINIKINQSYEGKYT